MRNRVAGPLVLGPLITWMALLLVAGPGARAESWSEGGTLLLRDGEARLIASSALGFDLRRQPAPEPPKARPLLRRQRPNTVSLGFQGQYGAIRGNSRLADGFDHGPGYAFRFRYMLSPSAALGFSFEHQRFGSIQPPLDQPGAPQDSHVVVTTVSAEGVFFIHREREFNPYFIGGFGYATPDIIFAEEQSSRANEGMFATVGVGFERFIRPRFSADFSVRGYALVSNSEFTSMGQVSLGIHLYPGD